MVEELGGENQGALEGKEEEEGEVRGSDHPTHTPIKPNMPENVKSVTRERWAAGKAWVAWPRLRCFGAQKWLLEVKTNCQKRGDLPLLPRPQRHD